MDNNEKIPDIEQEQQTDETSEGSVQSSEAGDTNWEAEAKKWKAIAIRKAKQAEGNKANAEAPKPDLKESSAVSRDEVVLLARGYDDTAIKRLQAISQANGVSLLEAENDEMFQAWKEKLEAEKKAEKAKLGASKGSPRTEPKKVFGSGMTNEDHKALWREKMGQ